MKRREKIFALIILLETILVILLSFLSVSLYKHFEKTSGIIDTVLINSRKIMQHIMIRTEDMINVLGNLNINFLTIFNNRELALGFWLLIFIIYAFSVRSVRPSIFNMLRVIFSQKLMIWYFTMLVYVFGMVYLLYYVGFWKPSFLKETVFWFLAAGTLISFRTIDKGKDLQYFHSVIKDNIKIFIILQFVSNLYTFSFLVEVILVFVAVLSTMLVTFIDLKPEYQDKNGQILKKFFNTLLALIGFVIIIQSIRLVIKNIDNIILLELVSKMVLPSILSILFVIYAYLFAVYASYELLFIRIKFNKTINDKYRNTLKTRILLFCNINLFRINNFIQYSKFMHSNIQDIEDINLLFRNYKEKIRVIG